MTTTEAPVTATSPPVEPTATATTQTETPFATGSAAQEAHPPPASPGQSAATSTAAASAAIAAAAAMSAPAASVAGRALLLGFLSCASSTMRVMADASRWVLFPLDALMEQASPEYLSAKGDAGAGAPREFFQLSGNILLCGLVYLLHTAIVRAFPRLQEPLMYPSGSLGLPIVLGEGTALAATGLVVRDPRYLPLSLLGAALCLLPAWYLMRLNRFLPQLRLMDSGAIRKRTSWGRFLGSEMWAPRSFVSRWGLLFASYNREGVRQLGVPLCVIALLEGITIGATDRPAACVWQVALLLILTLSQTLWLLRQRFFISTAMQTLYFVWSLSRVIQLIVMLSASIPAHAVTAVHFSVLCMSLLYIVASLFWNVHRRVQFARHVATLRDVDDVGLVGDLPAHLLQELDSVEVLADLPPEEAT